MLPLRLLRSSGPLWRNNARCLVRPRTIPTLPLRAFNSTLEEPAPHGTGHDQEGKPTRPPPKVPVLEDKVEDITILSQGMKQFLVDDKPIVPDVFSEQDFGNFEPVRAPPPAIPKRTRKTKAEREKEKLEGKPENQPHVPPHLQNPAESFRYRILMARIEGPEEMKKIEAEIEENFQKGENDKNKAAIESGLLQTQWKLRPLGFHSKWLWGLARKYSGDDFAVKYLVQSRKNLYNWYVNNSEHHIGGWGWGWGGKEKGGKWRDRTC